MSRKLRHVPEKTSLVEVTNRTIDEMFLIKPTRELEQIIIGIIGRAQRMYPLLIHSFCFMSNHYHILLTPGSSKRMADFMGFVNGNIAREAGRLAGWRSRFWAGRYHHIVVSEEDEAQIDRLRYILSHGCKEGLVASPREWPGATSVQAQLDGTHMEGLWFSRTAEYNARMRGQKHDRLAYAEKELVMFSHLPSWFHLSAGQNRELVADLVTDIEEETAQRHRKANTEPAGVPYVLAQHYQDKPKKPKRSPAPAFHAYAKKIRKAMEEAYRAFYAAFRTAADALKSGTIDAAFPEGSFPPGRPYVGEVPELAPG